MRILTGRGRFSPPASGRVMSTGMGLFLIALGAILLFALRTGSGFGLNLHVVGVIMMVVGILGLLLPAIAQGPKPGRLRRRVSPGSVGDPSVPGIHSAASPDVRRMGEDGRFAGPDGPGRRRDEL
jgi:Na+/melibiose symporter-like transporter